MRPELVNDIMNWLFHNTEQIEPEESDWIARRIIVLAEDILPIYAKYLKKEVNEHNNQAGDQPKE